mgnify:CR=1 FL=1
MPLLPVFALDPVIVAPPAASDDGVKEPAIDAFGVMLGPPEVVEGDA